MLSTIRNFSRKQKSSQCNSLPSKLNQGPANQSQIKFDTRDCRVGAELPWSCEALSPGWTALQKAQRHPLWNWPELRLLRAHIWKWLIWQAFVCEAAWAPTEDTEICICLADGFVSFYVLPHFPDGGNCSHWERNPSLCCKLTQGLRATPEWALLSWRSHLDPHHWPSAMRPPGSVFLLHTQIPLEEPQPLLLNESALFQNVRLHCSILGAIYFQALYPKVKGRKGLIGINNHLKSKVSEEPH